VATRGRRPPRNRLSVPLLAVHPHTLRRRPIPILDQRVGCDYAAIRSPPLAPRTGSDGSPAVRPLCWLHGFAVAVCRDFLALTPHHGDRLACRFLVHYGHGAAVALRSQTS